jgi:four helix bundle protein
VANSYKQLIVWQKAFLLTKYVYAVAKKLPPEERYGLGSQMQRCAVSVPSNIAEGQQRNNSGEYIQFLGIARGSVGELETQLLITQDIYGIDVQTEIALLIEVQKMLNATLSTLRTKR